MYNNKFVVAIKANGKILREFGETIYVPYSQEYTFLFKNLNSVRAQVRVSIDGTNATEGTWLVVPPNSEIELTRYIKDGNFDIGNRFKFIERTAAIENGPRGSKVDDGLVRVEFQFEKQPQLFTLLAEYDQYKKDYYGQANPLRSMFSGQDGPMYASCSTNDTQLRAQSASIQNEIGITVPGSISNQKFIASAWFDVEPTTHVMVLRLLGETESGTPVVKPVTVKSKPKCVTCAHVNKAKSKFCSECGAGLLFV